MPATKVTQEPLLSDQIRHSSRVKLTFLFEICLRIAAIARPYMARGGTGITWALRATPAVKEKVHRGAWMGTAVADGES